MRLLWAAFVAVASLLLAPDSQADGIEILVLCPGSGQSMDTAPIMSRALFSADGIQSFDAVSGELRLNALGVAQGQEWRAELSHGKEPFGLRLVVVADERRLFEGFLATDARPTRDEHPTVLMEDLGLPTVVLHRSFRGLERDPDPRRDPRLTAAALRLQARQALQAELADEAQLLWKRLRASSNAYTIPALREYSDIASIPPNELTRLLGLRVALVIHAVVLRCASAGRKDHLAILDAARKQILSAPGISVPLAYAHAMGGDPRGYSILADTIARSRPEFNTNEGAEIGRAALALAALGDTRAIPVVGALIRKDTSNTVIGRRAALAMEVLRAYLRARPIGPV